MREREKQTITCFTIIRENRQGRVQCLIVVIETSFDLFIWTVYVFPSITLCCKGWSDIPQLSRRYNHYDIRFKVWYLITGFVQNIFSLFFGHQHITAGGIFFSIRKTTKCIHLSHYKMMNNHRLFRRQFIPVNKYFIWNCILKRLSSVWSHFQLCVAIVGRISLQFNDNNNNNKNAARKDSNISRSLRDCRQRSHGERSEYVHAFGTETGEYHVWLARKWIFVYKFQCQSLDAAVFVSISPVCHGNFHLDCWSFVVIALVVRTCFLFYAVCGVCMYGCVCFFFV